MIRALVLTGLLAAPAMADSFPAIVHDDGDGRVGVGTDVVVKAGETLDGDLVCVLGSATVDGVVNGNVVVVGGSLKMSGQAHGDVVGVGTGLTFKPGSVIEGELVNVGGTIQRDGLEVHGDTVNLGIGAPLAPFLGSWIPGATFGVLAAWAFWWKLFALFLFFVCALLLCALVPDRIRLISEETPVRVFSAFLFGLIGYMMLILLQAMLFITVVGIPLMPLLYLGFVILKWMAMCGVFHHVGRRIGRALGREMSLLGAVVLGLLPFALLRMIPYLCVGGFIWFLVEIVGFGLLIVTRVGTRRSPAVPQPHP